MGDIKGLMTSEDPLSDETTLTFFSKLHQFSIRNVRISFIGFLALLFFCIYQVRYLEVRMDPYTEGGVRGGAHYWQNLSEVEFKDGHGVYLVFTTSEREFSLHEICQIEHWFWTGLNQGTNIKNWSSLLKVRRPQVEKDRMLFPTISNLDCSLILNSPATSTLGEIEKWGKYWSIFREAHVDPLLLGKSPNEYSIHVTFFPERGSTGEYDFQDVGNLKKRIEKNLLSQLPMVTLYMAGPSTFTYFLNEAMKKDSWVLGMVAVFIAVAFKVVFGTWISFLIFLTTLLFTFIFLFGLMATLGIPINILTNSLVLMTAIAAVEDFLFLTIEQKRIAELETKYFNQKNKFLDFLKIATPSFWTTMTTAIGFLSLGVSRVQIIKDFGIAAGVASLIEWAVVFLLLPVIFEMFSCRPIWFTRRHLLFRKMTYIFPSSMRARGLVKAVLFVGIIFGAVGFLNLNYDESPQKTFPSTHIQARSLNYLQEYRGWTGQIEILIPFDSRPFAERKTNLDIVSEKLSKIPGAVFLRSQKQDLKFLTRDLPLLDQELIKREYQSSSMNSGFESAEGTLRTLLYVLPQSIQQLKKFVSSAELVCTPPSCRLAGKAISYLEISEKIVETLLESFLVSILLVALTIFGLAKSLGVRRPYLLIIVSMWGPFVLIGLVWIFRIEINLVTSLFASIVVGLAGDNAIQSGKNDEGEVDLDKGADNMGEASLILALILFLSSLFFLGMTLFQLKVLGVLMATGFILNYVGDYMLLRSLTRQVKLEPDTALLRQNRKQKKELT